MSKVLSFQKEARAKLLEGVQMLSDAVTTTLGPKGRNVAIKRQWGVPIVVHDGVTVAREVEAKDPLVDIGVQLVREAAQKTNEEAGDGTTTATLLAYELITQGLLLVDRGVNPMVLRQQVYAALPKVLEELKRIARPVKSNDDIAKVAFISSADEAIGKLVAEAVERVGKDGLVTVDEGKGMESEIEYTEGMEFDKGYLSPYFVTNPQRMEAVIEEPAIALIQSSLSLNDEVVPLLNELVKVSKNIVIIADGIAGDALATLASNKMRGAINALAVLTPGVGDNRNNYLADMAILTGGKVISPQTDIQLDKDDSWIGRAKKVISTRESTVIIEGEGDKKEIKSRIESLKSQRDNEKSSFEKEKIKERLARLSTGIAVIKVSAKTEIDMREKMERVKDAVGSATAARDEGIVPGGGSIFLQMSKVLGEDTEGEKLLKEILQVPARKLMLNSGETNDVINTNIKKILVNKDESFGYEVESSSLTSLWDKGVIDPAKVVRLALENAISVGCSILTTDALIAIEPEDKNDRNRQQA